MTSDENYSYDRWRMYHNAVAGTRERVVGQECNSDSCVGCADVEVGDVEDEGAQGVGGCHRVVYPVADLGEIGPVHQL